ncbi:MAG: hypothetical protein ACE5HA_16595, partial [Anaerolineae bacterium]
TPTATTEPVTSPVVRSHSAYIALIAKGHRYQAYVPYPAPQAIARVQIPLLDALLRLWSQ